MFESRLSKVGQGPRSNNWNEMTPLSNDCDEIVIRNTYLNGLTAKTIQSQNIALMQSMDRTSLSLGKSRKILWSDNNLQRKDLLCSTNLNKELIYQKEIKPIVSHKKMKPTKSILKTKSSFGGSHAPVNNEQKKATSSSSVYSLNASTHNLNNSISASKSTNIYPVSIRDNTNLLNTYSNSNVNVFGSKADMASNANYGLHSGVNYSNNLNLEQTRGNYNKENDGRLHRIGSPDFNTPNLNSTQHRSFSVDQKIDRSTVNQRGNNAEVTKIIIAPNVQSITNTNINNIYIQNPNNLDLEKLTGRYSDFQNKEIKKEYTNIDVDRITNSIRSPTMNSTTSINSGLRQSLTPSSTQNKMSKSIDPRLMQNNYLLNTNVLE
jgi:hypothetical protein